MPKSTLLIYYLTLQPASPVLTPHLPRSLPLTQTTPHPLRQQCQPPHRPHQLSASSCTSSSFTPLNTTATGRSWSQTPFSRALAGKPNPPSSALSSFPPVCSPSTVTSSSLSTSGVQTSIPTDIFTDESDSDSSQKSADRLGRPAVEPQQPGCLKDSSSCSSNLASVGSDSIRL